MCTTDIVDFDLRWARAGGIDGSNRVTPEGIANAAIYYVYDGSATFGGKGRTLVEIIAFDLRWARAGGIDGSNRVTPEGIENAACDLESDPRSRVAN